MSSLMRRFPWPHFLLPQACLTLPARAARAAPPRVEASVARDPLDERRGEAMRRLFPKLSAWRSKRWEWGEALQTYAYFAQAATAADLEQRISHVERQRHFRH